MPRREPREFQKTIPRFFHVLPRPRTPSRQSGPTSLRVPPLTFRLVTTPRTSFSEPLVWSGISGRSSTFSNSALLACRRLSSRSRVTKPVWRVIEGASYRLRSHADLVPEHIRSNALIHPPAVTAQPKQRGRPPKNRESDHKAG